jgi:hypothetical protein
MWPQIGAAPQVPSRLWIGMGVAWGLLCGGSSAPAQSMAPKVVDRVKQATAIVQLHAAERSRSGGGLLVRADEKFAYIVTFLGCAVPVSDPEQPKPADAGTIVLQPRIEVVFPGLETPSRPLLADIVKVDEERLLALLKVEKTDATPQPFDLSVAPAKLFETIQVFAFVGSSPADASRESPSVLVEKLSVVAIRKPAPDEPGWIRIDQVIPPERAGSAVVDMAGKLVGLARQSDEDATAGYLTPRGDVKSFVEEALRAGSDKQRVAVSGKKSVGLNRKTPGTKAPRRIAPKIVSAKWGGIEFGSRSLNAGLDVGTVFLQLLSTGKPFQLSRSLFPAVDGDGRVSALQTVLRVGDDELDLILAADTKCLLSDLPPDLAAREESIWIESATWSTYPDGGSPKDVTGTVRDRVVGADGLRVGGGDLTEIAFGRPKMLTLRIKLGTRLLELSATESSVLRLRLAK